MNEIDPFDIDAQQAQRESAELKARLADQLAIDDFKWLMSNKRGRRFVWRLLERTGVFRTSFTGTSATYFNEGQRNVGLMLIAQVNDCCPDAYAQMLQESKQK